MPGKAREAVIHSLDAQVTRIKISGLQCEWWGDCKMQARYFVEGFSGYYVEVCGLHLSRGINEILGSFDLME